MSALATFSLPSPCSSADPCAARHVRPAMIMLQDLHGCRFPLGLRPPQASLTPAVPEFWCPVEK